MIQEIFTLNRLNGTVEYISPLAFMYSRVPLLVRYPKGLSNTTVTVSVVNDDIGESFNETRMLNAGSASFDLSRIMQCLAPDVTTMLQEQRRGLGAYTNFDVNLLLGGSLVWTGRFTGIYGALNANEAYRYNTAGEASPVNRRLWVNFPQTFALQRDENDEFYYQTAYAKLYPEDLNTDNFGYENNLMQSLRVLSDFDIEANRLLLQLKSGSAQTIGFSTDRAINAQAEVVGGNAPFWLRLQPDLTPRDASGVTYLRWLQRDGSIGYWLFRNGELQTSAEAGSSFQRYNANPNVPSYYVGEFVQFDGNPLLSDYAETRTMNLSAEIRNRDEYEYICGLLTSPVVDRLVDSETHEGWERVNIMPSSQGLSLRRDTPFSRTLELAIQLPRRDTIKL